MTGNVATNSSIQVIQATSGCSLLKFGGRPRGWLAAAFIVKSTVNDRLSFVARLLFLGFCFFGLSVQSFAEDVPKDVKFACTHHGPAHMSLTLTPEVGKFTARKIEFIAVLNGSKWSVKIDGADQQVGNGEKVKVHTGDTITWSIGVDGITHGVTFAEQDLAQALLEFDTTVGQPLVDLTTILTSQAWKDFGTKLWGTKETTGAGLLAACKVK